MNEKLIVEIYGIGCEAAAGGCCGQCHCGHRCGNEPSAEIAKTVGRLYADLAAALHHRGLDRQVEMTFIDLFEHGLEEYPSAQALVSAGYEPPLVMIGGEMVFYGGLDCARILAAIEAALDDGVLP